MAAERKLSRPLKTSYICRSDSAVDRLSILLLSHLCVCVFADGKLSCEAVFERSEIKDGGRLWKIKNSKPFYRVLFLVKASATRSGTHPALAVGS